MRSREVEITDMPSIEQLYNHGPLGKRVKLTYRYSDIKVI